VYMTRFFMSHLNLRTFPISIFFFSKNYGRVQPPLLCHRVKRGRREQQKQKAWPTRRRRRPLGGGDFCFFSWSPWPPYAGFLQRSPQRRLLHRRLRERGGRCWASWRRRGTPPTSAPNLAPAYLAITRRRSADSIFFWLVTWSASIQYWCFFVLKKLILVSDTRDFLDNLDFIVLVGFGDGSNCYASGYFVQTCKQTISLKGSSSNGASIFCNSTLPPAQDEYASGRESWTHD
jgi:hypothetical protein